MGNRFPLEFVPKSLAFAQVARRLNRIERAKIVMILAGGFGHAVSVHHAAVQGSGMAPRGELLRGREAFNRQVQAAEAQQGYGQPVEAIREEPTSWRQRVYGGPKPPERFQIPVPGKRAPTGCIARSRAARSSLHHEMKILKKSFRAKRARPEPFATASPGRRMSLRPSWRARRPSSAA